MALNAFLELHSERHGHIKGSATQTGREDKIIVHAANHRIVSPRQATTGVATGRRRHKPFIITKDVDQSSPLLYDVLVNNTNIPTWKLEFWKPSPTGQEVQHFTIELEDATISSIKFIMPDNIDPLQAQHHEREIVSFSYERITWTWEDGGITAKDDWKSKRGS